MLQKKKKLSKTRGSEEKLEDQDETVGEGGEEERHGIRCRSHWANVVRETVSRKLCLDERSA